MREDPVREYQVAGYIRGHVRNIDLALGSQRLLRREPNVVDEEHLRLGSRRRGPAVRIARSLRRRIGYPPGGFDPVGELTNPDRQLARVSKVCGNHALLHTWCLVRLAHRPNHGCPCTDEVNLRPLRVTAISGEDYEREYERARTEPGGHAAPVQLGQPIHHTRNIEERAAPLLQRSTEPADPRRRAAENPCRLLRIGTPANHNFRPCQPACSERFRRPGTYGCRHSPPGVPAWRSEDVPSRFDRSQPRWGRTCRAAIAR
ncbi:hypothetical protein EV649_5019 [Kribbella sp. VKM Ac-2569]|nr:hypothetical protein EV649_5019 [Kribbella sp. VKM Ac-2569]